MKLVPVAVQFRTKGEEDGWWLCPIEDYDEGDEDVEDIRVLYAIEENVDDDEEEDYEDE